MMLKVPEILVVGIGIVGMHGDTVGGVGTVIKVRVEDGVLIILTVE